VEVTDLGEEAESLRTRSSLWRRQQADHDSPAQDEGAGQESYERGRRRSGRPRPFRFSAQAPAGPGELRQGPQSQSRPVEECGCPQAAGKTRGARGTRNQEKDQEEGRQEEKGSRQAEGRGHKEGRSDDQGGQEGTSGQGGRAGGQGQGGGRRPRGERTQTGRTGSQTRGTRQGPHRQEHRRKAGQEN